MSGDDPMSEMSDSTRYRSQMLAEIIARRDDDTQRGIIEDYAHPLVFEPIEDFLISVGAWNHVAGLDVEPKMVFAHPAMLQTHPQTSAYYRGIALLPGKRVLQEVRVNVKSWETGKGVQVALDRAGRVARFYNLIISSIIEGKVDWALENGYRNIIATMGVTLDGMFRNTIGDMAETLVKERMISWLKKHGIIAPDAPETTRYDLSKDTIMRYGSEPDIDFVKNGKLVATIEIKGGRDPAGALERLGAMSKSFDQTPPGCQNFLVAGVVTPEMRTRLDEIGDIKVYMLDDLPHDGEKWEDFTNEVFHHAVRAI